MYCHIYGPHVYCALVNLDSSGFPGVRPTPGLTSITQVVCLCARAYTSTHPPTTLTPVAGTNFGPLSQTDISKSDFKNRHISRFCFVIQVIQVISSGKFSSAEEVDLSFISWTILHERDV